MGRPLATWRRFAFSWSWLWYVLLAIAFDWVVLEPLTYLLHVLACKISLNVGNMVTVCRAVKIVKIAQPDA